MGVCANCEPHNKHYLFMKHVLSVLRFINENYPQVIPIMWDDMLRNIDIAILKGKYSTLNEGKNLFAFNYSNLLFLF